MRGACVGFPRQAFCWLLPVLYMGIWEDFATDQGPCLRTARIARNARVRARRLREEGWIALKTWKAVVPAERIELSA
jgi:hypothetical protein